MTPPRLPAFFAARTPFFYGWAVLACLCCAGFARQGPAVSTLSVFVEPLTRDFGWSRTALSGAVSLGGILAAIISPRIGLFLDRAGSRLVLCYAVLTTGVALLALSMTTSLTMFYVLFCFARMNWASPFELGIYGAVNNWFVARRRLATSIATLAQMAGLVTMPVVAELVMLRYSWRGGWVAIGALTLIVGFLPIWLLLVRRPEDVGLRPDGRRDAPARGGAVAAATPELEFSRAQAIRTPAFWLLLAYTVLVYPIQAGISLHMAPHLTEHGIGPAIVATIVSTYSLMSAVASVACGFLPRRLAIRYPMAATGAFLVASALLMKAISSPGEAYLAAALFGFGVGGILTLLPICLGRLFRPRQFWRDPRGCVVGASRRAGGGTDGVGRAARRDRQLSAISDGVCGVWRPQRHRGTLRKAAADGLMARTPPPETRRGNAMNLLTRRKFGSVVLTGAAAALGGRVARAADNIHVGILPLASHAPTFIAEGKGYFEKQGLAAALISFEAAEPMAVAIAAGDVDFGVTAITGGLISLTDKGATVVIGGALREAQGVEGEKILVSKKAYDDGVTTPAKLKGRSFGITTAGSSFQYMAHKIAQKEGFADSDIELKPMQKVPVVIAALKSGQIDAWSIQPNIADMLTKDGQIVEIGKIADYIPNYQVTTVFTSTGNVAKRRDLVKRYLAAYAQGVADYNAALVDKTMGNDDTAAIVEMIHKYVYTSQPLDKADPLIRAGAMRISPDARINLDSVKDQLDWFESTHMVPAGVTMAKLVDTSFVSTD